MAKFGPGAIKVWSQNLFPFQVLKRAIRDKPDVVHVQFEFYGIHSFGPIYSSIGLPILLMLLRLARLKTVVTLHAVFPASRNQLAKVRATSPGGRSLPLLLMRSFLMLSYKLVGLLANGILVHAQVFKNDLVEHYDIPPSKVVVVPHGVDLWDPSGSIAGPASKVWSNPILYFGVLSPRKGIESLLKAFALLSGRRKDCDLLLAGASPPYYRGYEAALKDQAARLGLNDKIHFLGAVDNAQAHQLFERTKFVILPYSYNVSASGVLSWAIGHGVPVIVSNNEYFREELSQGDFGLMVTPEDPESLANAMENLLSREDLRMSLSAGAREAGRTRSWNEIASKTIEYYQRMISESEQNGHQIRNGSPHLAKPVPVIVRQAK